MTLNNNTKTPRKLSVSSANLLQSCEQRWYEYKVKETAKDPDYVEGDHFSVGKSFHHILEVTRYQHPKKVNRSMSDLLQECQDEHGLSEENKPYVHAMVLGFLREWQKHDYELVAVEFAVESETTIGYVDSLVKQPDGSWWILDLKTAKGLYSGVQAKLARNPQLNLYASFAPNFADYYGLDLLQFKGCIYWLTTRPRTVMKKSEDYSAHVLRMVENNVKSIAYKVNAGDMDMEERKRLHTYLWERSQKLESGKKAPIKNFNSCMNFFQPCPYWSQCHGKTYSEMEGLE